MRSVATLLTIALVLRSDPAPAASIGLFSSTDCSRCDLVVDAGQTAYIYIKFTGLQPGHGLLTASFKVDGVPPNWEVLAAPYPQVYSHDGDPVGPVGGTVAFAAPQARVCIGLYRVSLVATSAERDVVLRVVGITPPLSPWPGCPLASFCSSEPCALAPRTCVDGGALLINSTAECRVGIEHGTWSRVKRLYLR